MPKQSHHSQTAEYQYTERFESSQKEGKILQKNRVTIMEMTADFSSENNRGQNRGTIS